MQRFSRTHLSDLLLLQSAAANAGRERTATADFLADLGEIDARKLYVPAGYPSLYAFCLGELHLSEDAACKRIAVARTARRFPAIFEAVARGRLHLSALVLLAPHLVETSASSLLAAASHKCKAEVEKLLAERFPRSDVLSWVAPSSPQVAALSAPGRIGAPQVAAPRDERPATRPLSGQTIAVQFTFGRGAQDKLRRAQELLSHQIPSGDLAQIFERALDALIPELEKRKFAATANPRPARGRPSANPRHIPARVKRAVWERDGGRCTFTSEDGHRCEATKRLEFDHVVEVARGGEATVDGIRLLCRAHNQHAAERTFGPEFMRRKRIAAAEARASARGRTGCKPMAEAACAEEEQEDGDVVPWLRALGFGAAEARRAAARCDGMDDASLEERVRAALTCFRVGGTRVSSPAPAIAG